MEQLSKQYTIEHKALPDGQHRYSYSLDDYFFISYSQGEISGGEAEVNICLSKSGNRYNLDFSISGRVQLHCDRCLEFIMLPVWVEQSLELKEVPDADAGEDGIAVDKDADEIDLAPSIYELVELSLPMRRVHTEDDAGHGVCDVEMIKLLDSLNGENNSNSKTNDPRWDELKNLIN